VRNAEFINRFTGVKVFVVLCRVALFGLGKMGENYMISMRRSMSQCKLTDGIKVAFGFEHLKVTRHMLSGAFLAHVSFNVHCNQLIPPLLTLWRQELGSADWGVYHTGCVIVSKPKKVSHRTNLQRTDTLDH
jgi:hypothetical protein